MEQQRDYSRLNFAGYDKSISAYIGNPEGVLLFEEEVDPRSFRAILLDRQLISIPRHQFRTEMKELEKRIAGWEYQSIKNFDTSELGQLRERYGEMQRLSGQIKASERPVILR